MNLPLLLNKCDIIDPLSINLDKETRTISSEDQLVYQKQKEIFDSDWIAYFFKTELETLMIEEKFDEAMLVLQYYYIQYEELQGWTFYQTNVLMMYLTSYINATLIKISWDSSNVDLIQMVKKALKIIWDASRWQELSP